MTHKQCVPTCAHLLQICTFSWTNIFSSLQCQLVSDSPPFQKHYCPWAWVPTMFSEKRRQLSQIEIPLKAFDKFLKKKNVGKGQSTGFSQIHISGCNLFIKVNSGRQSFSFFNETLFTVQWRAKGNKKDPLQPSRLSTAAEKLLIMMSCCSQDLDSRQKKNCTMFSHSPLRL